MATSWCLLVYIILHAAIRKAMLDAAPGGSDLKGSIDTVTGNLGLIRQAARLDNLLLRIPGATKLAGDVVLCATKQ